MYCFLVFIAMIFWYFVFLIIMMSNSIPETHPMTNSLTIKLDCSIHMYFHYDWWTNLATITLGHYCLVCTLDDDILQVRIPIKIIRRKSITILIVTSKYSTFDGNLQIQDFDSTNIERSRTDWSEMVASRQNSA